MLVMTSTRDAAEPAMVDMSGADGTAHRKSLPVLGLVGDVHEEGDDVVVAGHERQNVVSAE